MLLKTARIIHFLMRVSWKHSERQSMEFPTDYSMGYPIWTTLLLLGYKKHTNTNVNTFGFTVTFGRHFKVRPFSFLLFSCLLINLSKQKFMKMKEQGKGDHSGLNSQSCSCNNLSNSLLLVFMFLLLCSHSKPSSYEVSNCPFFQMRR